MVVFALVLSFRNNKHKTNSRWTIELEKGPTTLGSRKIAARGLMTLRSEYKTERSAVARQ